MLSIKLSRAGKKKQPIYRMIVTEKTRDPYGKFLEIVGNYNPRLETSVFNLKEDRVKYWLSVGAQPTDTIHNLLVDAGLITGDKVKKGGRRLTKKAAAAKKATDEAKAKEKPTEEPKAKPTTEPKTEEPKETATPTA